jgi:23S rRNA (cytosine1962-C5)-methyltransferase
VFDERTTGYRLVAGEGDGLPGLIIDVYDRTAVLKLDGGAPESFYQPEGIAGWLKSELEIEHIVQRQRGRGLAGQWILADGQAETVRFLENGLKFTADVLRGQKTGFFLDQRDNRGLIRTLSRGARVLNLFSFNGGFSVAAGAGGAAHVTSVDIAAAAMNAAELHWKDNCLPDNAHEAVVADVFEFLAEAAGGKRVWDVVISDPPSFAPNEKSRPAALAAYSRLAQACASVTRAGGKLALASCSSHVDSPSFTAACLEGLSRARRKGVLLAERGLPLDHPTPWAMPELRYLKFLLLGLD